VCGIIGFVGKQRADRIIFNSLKKLEYRGYDSWGMAFPGKESIVSVKRVGAISSLPKKTSFSNSFIGLGHTRWATHGGVEEKNAHPLFSCDKRIAVEHNGIIENFSSLKKELIKKGHRFRSETDSEVIAHLIEERVKRGDGLLKAVASSCRKLNGSYAFLVFSLDEPEKIIAVRNESPLILGISRKGIFASSDQLPILSFTNKFVFLDDGEMALLEKNSFKCFALPSLKPIKKPINSITSTITTSGKKKYSYFMMKEIMEQPTVMKDVLRQEKKNFDSIKKLLAKRRIFFVANGTSFNAAMIGRDYFNRIAGKNSEVINASEFCYEADFLPKNSVLIAISQSGETADVLDAVREAKKKKLPVISVLNIFGSTLDRMSDKRIYLNCGEEIGVASTKAFTSQVAILYLLANALNGRFNEGLKELREIPKKMKKTIQLNHSKVIKLSKKIKNKNDVYFIARSINFPIALEGALKLKEISYLHAEAFYAGELKHGTLSLIESATPVIAIAPSDSCMNDTIRNAIEAKSRGAMVVGVSDKKNNLFDLQLLLPKTSSLLYPLIAVVPLQLLSYYTAISLKRNPDKPRNLAKSVTVK